MQDKLLALCELQLTSILEEIDCAVMSASHSATQGLKFYEKIEEITANAESQKALKLELANILMRLQFHDELSQRINHLLELLRIMKDDNGENRLGNMSATQLLEQVSGIFSIRAEFGQLHKIFPQYSVQDAGDAIEFF